LVGALLLDRAVTRAYFNKTLHIIKHTEAG